MTWNGDERRRFPRATFPCKIIIGSCSETISSHTENISKGGIRIILNVRLEHASNIGLEIHIRKDKPIQCEGRVIWVREITNPLDEEASMFDTGIEFSVIDKTDKAYVAKIVDIIAHYKRGR